MTYVPHLDLVFLPRLGTYHSRIKTLEISTQFPSPHDHMTLIRSGNMTRVVLSGLGMGATIRPGFPRI